MHDFSYKSFQLYISDLCCITDIDDCVNHTCANGGSCLDGLNSYTCNCTVGFTGGHCDNSKLKFSCIVNPVGDLMLSPRWVHLHCQGHTRVKGEFWHRPPCALRFTLRASAGLCQNNPLLHVCR